MWKRRSSVTVRCIKLTSYNMFHADGSSEVHTIEIRNGNDPVARFRFQDNHHNSGVWAPSSLFSHRLGGDLLRIASLEGGFTKLPSLLGFAFFDTYYVIKFLPHFQSKAKFLILLYWSFAILVTFAAFVLLILSWRKNQTNQLSLLPVYVIRVTSILALISFSAVCVKTPSTADDSTYLLLANGVLGSGSSGNGNSNILSVLGTFYYISTHNGSTDIVTNADGMAIARFAYEPFGKVNAELTDLDPDRNGVHYGESFMFTGQEFEPETGLYNYKARIYDAETGRFLQPDPVHTDQPGQDNWDRYQYVWNNPVNYVDPDGEVVSCGFNTMIGHRYTGPSTCSDTLPNKLDEKIFLWLMISMLTDNEKDQFKSQTVAMTFALQKYKQFKDNQGQTPVDKASFRHDNESPGKFFTGEKKWRAIESDWRWIREAVGNFFTPNQWGHQLETNWSAQPKWVGRRFGDFGRAVGAIVGTSLSIFSDLVVIGIGVPLFSAHIVFNLVGIGIERATNVRKERWVMRKDRLYMSSARSNHFLMRSARFKGSYMPADRFNNLGNPSKWRL